jgi:Domain of unknown function (DUF4198)
VTARRTIPVAVGMLLALACLVQAHDLFLKLDTYFLEPHTRVRVTVLNGTFAKSEAFVTPDRIVDLSLVGLAGRTPLPATAWSRGPDSTSLLTLVVGDTGTYVIGVSTRPREIALPAAEFNAYLEEDGIPDVLEDRRRRGELAAGAREQYSKHVKAVFQVGRPRTAAFGVALDYPAEIVPLDNPYSLAQRAPLRVRCLVDGRPVADQMVLWGGERDGRALPERRTRTDSDGIAVVTLGAAGRWYVKFVHMIRASSPNIDYESRWASLTFETR